MILKPSANNVPAISVGAGMTVTVQGLQVQGATGTAGDGIFCQGTSSRTSTLAVLESTIQDNKGHGIVGTYCDVTLRRNVVLSNDAGGVDLSKGTFVVVNNVVAKNGKLTSSRVGGVSLVPPRPRQPFLNNTIANNSSSSIGAGVMSAQVDLVNSIVHGNLAAAR